MASRGTGRAAAPEPLDPEETFFMTELYRISFAGHPEISRTFTDPRRPPRCSS
ncbi:hypothetical protein NSERUTF1_4201 [Nocardia seriolae]|nr:hypothetical protein NSERUTF1_4201 [Nocardia seriolae]